MLTEVSIPKDIYMYGMCCIVRVTTPMCKLRVYVITTPAGPFCVSKRSPHHGRNFVSIRSTSNLYHGYTPVKSKVWLHARKIEDMATRPRNHRYGWKAYEVVDMATWLRNRRHGWKAPKSWIWPHARETEHAKHKVYIHMYVIRESRLCSREYPICSSFNCVNRSIGYPPMYTSTIIGYVIMCESMKYYTMHTCHWSQTPTIRSSRNKIYDAW